MQLQRDSLHTIPVRAPENDPWLSSSSVKSLVGTFFRIYCFVFSRRTKFIQVWNNLRVTKLRQNPFNNTVFELFINDQLINDLKQMHNIFPIFLILFQNIKLSCFSVVSEFWTICVMFNITVVYK